MTRMPLVLLSSFFILLACAFVVAQGDNDLIGVGVFSVLLAAVAIVGYLVASREPANPIGWLMLTIALLMMTSSLTDAYAGRAVREPGSLPGAAIAAWITLWVSPVAAGLVPHLLLRFPDGMLPSPRWRWVGTGITVTTAVIAVTLAIRPGPTDSVPSTDNPLGLASGQQLVEAVSVIAQTLLPLLSLLAIASLVSRYGRSDRTVRQQLKLFVYAVVLFPVLFAAAMVVDRYDTTSEKYFVFLLIVFALLLIPVSMGFAILRYRLYDIDVVINRTLVYGGLTAFLGLSYVILVVALQQVLGVFGSANNLAVAASTLAVAGLFSPARRKIQGFIDHRFYRRKYDAERTLLTFSEHLREEVDLDSLSARLVAVVQDTMQPAQASLWLRRVGRVR